MDDFQESKNEAEPVGDEWGSGDDHGEPIPIDELKRLDLQHKPEHIAVMDDYFPETTIWREGEIPVFEIQEHLYTKYGEHKSRRMLLLKQWSALSGDSRTRDTHSPNF